MLIPSLKYKMGPCYEETFSIIARVMKLTLVWNLTLFGNLIVALSGLTVKTKSTRFSRALVKTKQKKLKLFKSA